MTERRTLFVGLGTPHGDDRVGLCVAEQLAACGTPGVQVRLATAPGAVLDWLDDVERLVVCDACRSETLPVGALRQWEWPAAEIETIRFAGSHDLSLPAILTLAERLGRLPRKAIVVGVGIGNIKPGETMSPELRAVIPKIVENVRGVLAGA